MNLRETFQYWGLWCECELSPPQPHVLDWTFGVQLVTPLGEVMELWGHEAQLMDCYWGSHLLTLAPCGSSLGLSLPCHGVNNHLILPSTKTSLLRHLPYHGRLKSPEAMSLHPAETFISYVTHVGHFGTIMRKATNVGRVNSSSQFFPWCVGAHSVPGHKKKSK